MSAPAAAKPAVADSHTRAVAPHGHAGAHSEFGHVAPVWQLLAVFGSLLFLTFVTVFISRGPITTRRSR